MKYLITYLSLIVLCSFTNTNDYLKLLDKIDKQKDIFRELIHMGKVQDESASEYLTRQLTKNIFPAWHGTEWGFNGISNTPRQGEIACGYFVSTTLKHVGFNLNRYKLAQKAAEVIVKEIVGDKQISRLNNLNEVKCFFEDNPYGLYVVGLSYHVGFLNHTANGLYFVHSDYVSDEVKSELYNESEAFSASEVYVIGAISNNEILIDKWLNNEKIY